MKALKAYSINFAGLKEGQHRFEYQLDKKFLANFEDALLEDVNVGVQLLLDKHNNLLELHFSWTGTVAAVCDVCNEDFQLPIKGKEDLIVKFVSEMPDDTDEPEVIYLQMGESSINIAFPLYEAVVLQVPLRKVHPEDKNGNPTCDPEVIRYLNENQGDANAQDSSDDDEGKSVWDELKKLK